MELLIIYFRLAAQDKENTHQGSEKTADAANPTYHKIQMISMSATVGNLREISTFLESELYTDSWRPVQLQEYIKVRYLTTALTDF